jgi:hypothetical protein
LKSTPAAAATFSKSGAAAMTRSPSTSDARTIRRPAGDRSKVMRKRARSIPERGSPAGVPMASKRIVATIGEPPHCSRRFTCSAVSSIDANPSR